MLPIVLGSDAGEALEVLAEECWIGKTELVGNLCDGLVAMSQFNFDVGDEGTVNPIFGGHATGLTHNGAEITLGEA